MFLSAYATSYESFNLNSKHNHSEPYESSMGIISIRWISIVMFSKNAPKEKPSWKGIQFRKDDGKLVKLGTRKNFHYSLTHVVAVDGCGVNNDNDDVGVAYGGPLSRLERERWWWWCTRSKTSEWHRYLAVSPQLTVTTLKYWWVWLILVYLCTGSGVEVSITTGSMMTMKTLQENEDGKTNGTVIHVGHWW